jgi:hypothetical protein
LVRAFGAVALLLAVTACQGPYLTEEAFYQDAAPVALAGEEIQALLLGNTVESDSPEAPYAIHFPDGALMLGERSNNYRDRGTWRVTEGQICARFDNWWGNVERCWQVLRAGDTVTWVDPYGEVGDADARVVPGNPAGLE